MTNRIPDDERQLPTTSRRKAWTRRSKAMSSKRARPADPPTTPTSSTTATATTTWNRTGSGKTPPSNNDRAGLLARLGPGVVTGVSDDDPSGIATYTQVGSRFGFGMLWTL